jgi:outer membrane lipoprotein SlyB
MTYRRLSTVACASTLVALAACSSTPLNNDVYARGGPQPPVYGSQPAVYNPPPVYDSSYGQAARADYGTVRSIQLIPNDSRASGAGAVIGAVLGGVLGNQIGHGDGRAAATIVGAVGGGVAGNAIEKRTRNNDEIYQVGVRFEDGSVRNFNFQQVGDLRIGDRVRWDNGQLLVL